MQGATPSNHESAWKTLESRGVKIKYTDRRHGYGNDLDNRISRLVKNTSSALVSAVRDPLINVLQNPCSSEEAFDSRLFLALGRGFELAGWKVAMIPSLADPDATPEKLRFRILLNSPATPAATGGRCAITIGDEEYAMGFSRRSGLQCHPNSPLAKKPFPDHSWAVFKQKVAVKGQGDDRDDLAGWILHCVLATWN
jgi:hypothetical protein